MPESAREFGFVQSANGAVLVCSVPRTCTLGGLH